MKAVLHLLVAAAAGVASPALAESPPVSPAPPAEATADKEPKKICRSVALNTDSRRKERLCLTPAEWRELNNPR